LKKLLTICPSRGRPDRLKIMLESFYGSKKADNTMIVYVAEDDPKLEEYKKFKEVVIGPRLTIGKVFNKLSSDLPDYDYYGEINDDHLYKTIGWDEAFIDELEFNSGWGIISGWDMLHPKKFRMPSGIVMSGNIIKTLGYMVTPHIEHTYIDNYFMTIGRFVGYYYRPDILIEHRHVLVKKAEMDDNYKWVLSPETMDVGKKGYDKYIAEDFKNDIDKLSEAMAKTKDSGGHPE
jgi:hypothetical protein